MKTPVKGINLKPTWPEAARIIAAALENGTGTGREMARAELYRMAAILDDLQTREGSGKSLWEVITDRPKHLPFGQTFGHLENAEAYAAAMEKAGYSADISPEFTTPQSFTEAMQIAAEVYGDAAILADIGTSEPTR